MDLAALVSELRSYSFEKEWFEFKENWLQPAQLGEYVSAISNSAAMLGRKHGYFVWGVSDEEGHELVGTSFDPDCEVNQEPLKHFLARQLEPSADFDFFEGDVGGKRVVVLRIGCARIAPTAFNGSRFIRIGSSKENLRRYPQREAALFGVLAHGVPTVENTPSERQNLSFSQLLVYYAAKGVKLNPETFETNLGLRMNDGRYNLLAQLLSDDSGMPIRVAIFTGKDKTSNMYSIREFGHQCLFYSLDEILRYGDVVNVMQADERDRVVERKDIPLFDEEAFREALVNAFVHNAWVDGNEPMVTVFSDRIEILSRGTLPPRQTMRGFFAGESVPVNRKLSEIFLQLHISEKTGRGVPRIVERCGRSSFEFRETSIVVTIPFTRVNGNVDEKGPVSAQKLSPSAKEKLHDRVLSAMRSDPNITKARLATLLDVSESSIDRAVAALKKAGAIERVGSNKSGHWHVIE
ncbi:MULTISPECIES: RNA-binding domain-containing protein [unclassified Adlercreutzia]|uniref:RNA-binding domain-containing protein n=1 Tax=unclassified Adlercreutzia TaxID=2636013 RepID=UPI0013EC16CE|nr:MULTISPECIES: RNA-binding domain-containing protein [unclassified Adlercreutzia]